MTEFVRGELTKAPKGLSSAELRAALEKHPRFASRLENRRAAYPQLIARMEASGELEIIGDRLVRRRPPDS